jgi:hypothetical protein
MAGQHIESFPLSSASARASSLRAVVAHHLRTMGSAVWAALEAHGQARADRELLQMAESYRWINPTLSRQLRSFVHGGSSY